MLSKEQDLIRLCTKDSFIVHLDQFVVHCAPLYYFVKGVQSPNISLHQCLIMVLELISKLLARLGHSVVLSPASFFRHLYDNGKPKIFPAKNKGLQYSIDNSTVQRALDNLDTEAIKISSSPGIGLLSCSWTDCLCGFTLFFHPRLSGTVS